MSRGIAIPQKVKKKLEPSPLQLEAAAKLVSSNPGQGTRPPNGAGQVEVASAGARLFGRWHPCGVHEIPPLPERVSPENKSGLELQLRNLSGFADLGGWFLLVFLGVGSWSVWSVPSN